MSKILKTVMEIVSRGERKRVLSPILLKEADRTLKAFTPQHVV